MAALPSIDRVLLRIAPRVALRRIRARAAATHLLRHYEAAQGGRRTSGWNRSGADANATNLPALARLRFIARDLVRNNGWATNVLRVIARNTVGWGIVPQSTRTSDRVKERARDIWALWAEESTECDADGLLTFAGIQRLVLDAVARDGEVLVRRRFRRLDDGLTIPLQLQVLEADFLDVTKDGVIGPAGGPIIQGVEFDRIGRRVAYWLFDTHPGANRLATAAWQSHRVPASEILHVFRVDRPGQVRGVSWFAPSIVKLHDFDDYEDAVLMRQKVAACFTAFVTDTTGEGKPIGLAGESSQPDLRVETLEPGMINYLAPGEQVSFASPPTVQGESGYSATVLRRICAGIGVTYEDVTGDYSQVNFSSARMSRIAHWGNVHDWRWNMLIPLLCMPVWRWAMEAAVIAGQIDEAPGSSWTPPPMPMIDPDKEGLAYMRNVRSGAMTPDEMVREMGSDPETHWREYAASLERLDKLGIIIDSDARRVSAQGVRQKDDGPDAMIG